MEGDIRREDGDKKDDEEEDETNRNKEKCDDEVKITLFGSKKRSKTEFRHVRKEDLEDRLSEHNLPVLNYNFRSKYKHFHDREYGVYYHRDYAAYSYRGYVIKEPKPKICPMVEEKASATKWVQYMTHAEIHLSRPPRMYYSPNDNSFVQITLLMLLFCLLVTWILSYPAYYSKRVRIFFVEKDCIWLPAIFAVVFSIYMALCSSCSRIFPTSLCLLIFNVFGTSIMCMYLTAVQDTHGMHLALFCIVVTVLLLIILALYDFDFRRFKLLIFTGVFSWLLAYILIRILGDYKEEWLPFLPRRENMLVFGVMLYCLSVVLILQLILGNRTIKLADDEYAIGTFMLYNCIPCLFMKLVGYLGLYDDDV